MGSTLDSELGGKTWQIFCADGHPSYNYRLEQTGEFIGAPAESFDIHVERIARGWEFEQRGACQAVILPNHEFRPNDALFGSGGG